jgi:hypothetical protein
MEQDVLRLFETAEETLGTLCALVNYLGIIGGFARVEAVDAVVLERLLAVKCKRALFSVRARRYDDSPQSTEAAAE